MNIVERNDKNPFMIFHETKEIPSGILQTIESEDESSSSVEVSRETSGSNRGRRNRRRNTKEIKDVHESDSESRKEHVDEVPATKVKRRKKRRYLTICTSNCKYDVVRRVAAKFGMKEVTEDSSWNLYWTDLSISIERAKDMKRYQKVNHFPGMTEICRKDLLARNLNRMLKLFPKDYNFFPKTWCFPADHGEAIAYSKVRRSKTFIIKPDTGCQGRGIFLTKNLKDIKASDRMICQVYIAKPYLIDGYKFDLRIYALITSCDPLRIYVYDDGLARFATSRYKEPTGHNTSNVFMHLTNYAVNKHSRMYIVDDEIGSKRKISTLIKWLKLKAVDVDELWSKIDEIIIKTIVAAYPVLKHSYRTCFPMHDRTYACFELLGFDVLLDWKLKPYLLEVNHSPSFHTDAQIDKDVKESLLMDTFEMLNLQQCDKRKIMEEDRKRVRDRLLQGVVNVKDHNLIDGACTTTTNSGGNNGVVKVDKAEYDYTERQLKWEDEHIGHFRRIYPCADSARFEPFFKQSGTTVFQDTVASRAREEASRVQREEYETRIREQEGRKAVGKLSDQKITPESPGTAHKRNVQGNSRGYSVPGSAQGTALLRNIPANRQRSGSRSSHQNSNSNSSSRSATIGSKRSAPASFRSGNLYSFQPEIISESEERERISALAQRDFLIKSYGILEQIYMAMKKNGTLRDNDERKYGIYGKVKHVDRSLLEDNKLLHHRCRNEKCKMLKKQCSQCLMKGSKLIQPCYAKDKAMIRSTSQIS